MEKIYAIIEIGSNNTKTHVYDHDTDNVLYDNTTTIEFKKNYKINNKIITSDLEKLQEVIDKALEYTKDINIYGCSIFRNITKQELEEINDLLYSKYKLKIEVVSQEDEANFTAIGCYNDINYDKNMCVFIGGGGSTELIFVNNKKIIGKKYYDFGVVDVTNKFNTLKNDIPECTFDEVYSYINELVGDIDIDADVLVLAGGDHLYWYNNAEFKLDNNNIYSNNKQKYMITREKSDEYDKTAYKKSLNKIRENSDNPVWFDGSRAMKTITNLISHKVNAKYVIPTSINMEDGIRKSLQDFKT